MANLDHFACDASVQRGGAVNHTTPRAVPVVKRPEHSLAGSESHILFCCIADLKMGRSPHHLLPPRAAVALLLALIAVSGEAQQLETPAAPGSAA